MKNLYRIILGLALIFVVGQTTQAAIVTLDVLDNNISVGENFDVEVWVDGQDIGEDLLAFGFDVSTPGTLFFYAGYTIESGFFDASDPFKPVNVAGFGLDSRDDLLLATLSFNAISPGTDNLTINGIYDGFFYDLFYGVSGFDIDASTGITINDAVPEPGLLLLLSLGYFSLLMSVRMSKRV